eukprot:scaffold29.g5921.t1
MEAVQQFVEARAADLTVAQEYVAQLVQDKALPEGDLAASVITTCVGTLLLANLATALLFRRSRKAVLETLETILAIILICILLGIVLGLPLVIVYLVLKGIAFGLQMLLGIPVLAALATRVGIA